MIMANWDELDLGELAAGWMRELSEGKQSNGEDVGLRIAEMNFFASADVQWRFLLEAVACAHNDDQLGHIAAGPLEHLLGHHGDRYIDLVEEKSSADPIFARMTTGAWQNQMSEDVWARLQRIQIGVANPI